MKKVSLITIAACLLVGVTVFVTTSLAQGRATSTQDWSRLKIVTYATGLTGFFDPDTGKLYVYDSNMANCFAIRELAALGEPLKKLKN